MSEATQIILNLLWRFYPIAWLTTTIVRALARITSWLEDEESWFQLTHSEEDCAFVGGWLALAEERLNELIVMKAMKLLKRPYYPPQPCGHHMVRAIRTPQEIYRRLCRLVALYHDHKRLYERRAQKLQRLFAQAELRLETIHHPCQTLRVAMVVMMMMAASSLSPSSSHGLSAAGFSAQRIRAPPHRRTPDNQACPTRRSHRREREIMRERSDHMSRQPMKHQRSHPRASRRRDPRIFLLSAQPVRCKKDPRVSGASRLRPRMTTWRGRQEKLLPTAYCLLPTAHCLLPTAYSLFPTPYSRREAPHTPSLSASSAKLATWMSNSPSAGAFGAATVPYSSGRRTYAVRNPRAAAALRSHS